MSNLVLYSLEASPPCRAVILTADLLGLNLKIKETSLLNKDHLTPDFTKMNPLHTVPTLDDNGFCLTDSHAIVTYLMNKYGKDDILYPKDPQKRAIIDQFLHADNGTLFPAVKGTFKPIIVGLVQLKSFTEDHVNTMKEHYEILNAMLEGKEWLAGGTHFTLADVSCLPTILAMTIICPGQEYTNVQAWLKRCQKHIPNVEKLILPGHKMLHDLLHSKFQ